MGQATLPLVVPFKEQDLPLSSLSPAEPDQKASQTQASIGYELLRNDIVTGRLPAESKLKIRDLCSRYGLAMSAIREALNRLVQDGLAQLVDLKGFTVSPISEQDLLELTRARVWLNEMGVRESIAHGDAAWEESVLLAYHRMAKIKKYRDDDPDIVTAEWEAAHRLFHAALISACRSTWIIKFCEQLFHAADRYRYLSRSTNRQRTDDHKEIMEATIARDADTAARLLRAHFERTAELSLKSLKSWQG